MHYYNARLIIYYFFIYTSFLGAHFHVPVSEQNFGNLSLLFYLLTLNRPFPTNWSVGKTVLVE